MWKVLTINYSQTGQLSNILSSVVGPISKQDGVEVENIIITPKTPFPFPWSPSKFFKIFPETVSMDAIELESIETKYDQYDLIILSYQVWFLTPSLPVSSFLQTQQAKSLFNHTPVVTIIGCRGMWLSAQEKMKKMLSNLNAKLVDNIVLHDECGAAFSFLATPLWMMTGKKQAISWVPPAGVSEKSITEASRFGHAIADHLTSNQKPICATMLKGLSAVKINEKFIASEKVGNRSFFIWSKILKIFGHQDSLGRVVGLSVYVIFLIMLILTVVPVAALIKKLISPFTKNKVKEQKSYYAQPSGE